MESGDESDLEDESDSEDEGEDVSLGQLDHFNDEWRRYFNFYYKEIIENPDDIQNKNKNLQTLQRVYKQNLTLYRQYIERMFDQKHTYTETRLQSSILATNLLKCKRLKEDMDAFFKEKEFKLGSRSPGVSEKAQDLIIKHRIKRYQSKIIDMQSSLVGRELSVGDLSITCRLPSILNTIKKLELVYDKNLITPVECQSEIQEISTQVDEIEKWFMESNLNDSEPEAQSLDPASLRQSPRLQKTSTSPKQPIFNQAFQPFTIKFEPELHEHSISSKSPAVSITPVELRSDDVQRHPAREAHALDNKMVIKQSPNDEIECFLSPEINATAKQQAAMQTARMFLETDDGGDRQYAFGGEPEQLKLVVAAILWLNPEFNRERMVFSSVQEGMEDIDTNGRLLSALVLDDQEYQDFRGQFLAPASSITITF